MQIWKYEFIMFFKEITIGNGNREGEHSFQFEQVVKNEFRSNNKLNW